MGTRYGYIGFRVVPNIRCRYIMCNQNGPIILRIDHMFPQNMYYNYWHHKTKYVIAVYLPWSVPFDSPLLGG